MTPRTYLRTLAASAGLLALTALQAPATAQAITLLGAPCSSPVGSPGTELEFAL